MKTDFKQSELRRQKQRVYYRRWLDKHPANKEKAAANARKWAVENPVRMLALRRKYSGWAPGEHERAEACRPGPGYACPICKTEEPGQRGWMADHDHRTGLFRAWVCHNCNVVLGLMDEDPERLRAAAAYLVR